MNTSDDSAQLLDAAGKAISTGRVLDFRDGSFHYYPADLAPSEKILGAAVIVLGRQSQRLRISHIQPCQQEVSHELHFHVRAA